MTTMRWSNPICFILSPSSSLIVSWCAYLKYFYNRETSHGVTGYVGCQILPHCGKCRHMASWKFIVTGLDNSVWPVTTHIYRVIPKKMRRVPAFIRFIVARYQPDEYSHILQYNLTSNGAIRRLPYWK